MSFVLSASKLMKASQVRELCQQMKNNPTLLLLVEAEAKEKLSLKKEKAAS